LLEPGIERCSMSRLGFLQTRILTGLVLLSGQTRLALCQKVLSDGVSDLANQISSSVAQQQKKKVAVISFRELDGRTTVLGTYVSEELGTALFKLGGLDIVERTMLDKILGELKLGQSGVIDPNTAKRVGEVAGVDAIVTGTITDLQSYIAVNCRLIDVQSGRVFAAAQTKIVKDDDVRKIMGVQISQAPGRDLASSPSSSAAPDSSSDAAGPRVAKWSDHQIELQVARLARSRRDSRVTLVATNLTANTAPLYFFRTAQGQSPPWRVYLVDNLGNRYQAVGGSMFSDSPGYYAGYVESVDLVPNLPLRVELLFDALSESASSVKLVIVGDNGRNLLKVTAVLGPIALR